MSSAQIPDSRDESMTKETNFVRQASDTTLNTVALKPSTVSLSGTHGKKKTWTEVLSHTSIQAIPEAVSSKRPSKRVIWLTVVIVSNVCCVIHLYLLLQTFIYSPNAVSISVERRDELTMPRIHICQTDTRFIDPDLAVNVSAAYFYALELGVGLIRSDEPLQYKFHVDLQEVEREYENIMTAYDGNISAAHVDFYSKYGMKCEAIFRNCDILQETPVNCCDIFEPVYTLNGLCWASKKGSIVVHGPESLASFRFRLKFSEYSKFKIAHFLPQPENSDDIYSMMTYFVGIADFLDQGLRWSEKFVVGLQEWYDIKLTQSHVTWMVNPKVCVDDPENEKTLKFFQDYNSANCAFEKVVLKNLDLLLNSSCELPLVELMKPGYVTSKPCNLSQILTLYNFHSLDDQSINAGVATFLSALANFSVSDLLADRCALTPENNQTLPRCTVRHLNELNFTGEALNTVNSLGKTNSVPMSLFGVMAKLQAMRNITADACLPLCDSTLHIVSKEWRTDRRRIPLPESEIFLYYSTKDVEVIEEQPRQSISEYVAMIGGQFGLWNGASIISFVHLIALIGIGMGFDW